MRSIETDDDQEEQMDEERMTKLQIERRKRARKIIEDEFPVLAGTHNFSIHDVENIAFFFVLMPEDGTINEQIDALRESKLLAKEAYGAAYDVDPIGATVTWFRARFGTTELELAERLESLEEQVSALLES